MIFKKIIPFLFILNCVLAEYPWNKKNPLPIPFYSESCNLPNIFKYQRAAAASESLGTARKCMPFMKKSSKACQSVMRNNDLIWSCVDSHLHFVFNQNNLIVVFRDEVKKYQHAGCKIDKDGVLKECYGDSSVKSWNNIGKDVIKQFNEMMIGVVCLNSQCLLKRFNFQTEYNFLLENDDK